MIRILKVSFCLLIILCLTPAAGSSQQSGKLREPDVIYVPTPQNVVDAMLKLANVHSGDVVYDLGCGDGRIVVTAAKQFGVRGMGIDINPERIDEARENAQEQWRNQPSHVPQRRPV